MNVFAARILGGWTPTATFTVKNPDILEVPSASDRKTWHERDGRDKFDWLQKMSRTKGVGVGMKIGTGQFRQQVDFNLKYKNPDTKFSFTLGKRRGYTPTTVELS